MSVAAAAKAPTVVRRCWRLRGTLQGIGLRPYIYRLAKQFDLTGSVRNTGAGVEVDVEGAPDRVDAFADALLHGPPGRDAIVSVQIESRPPTGADTFFIAPSLYTDTATALPTPDRALCADCRQELLDPDNRRHRYPLITCAVCGPRYSILERLPFDREHTAMRAFMMCARCAAEYNDPADRRYHAQTIACADCGPRAALLDGAGAEIACADAAIATAAQQLRDGAVVALKGLGGFQLLADATDTAAVARLRQRKRRPDKPFAVLVDDLDAARRHVRLDDVEQQALTSAAGPIVLGERLPSSDIAAAVAPGLPWLGVMLATTGLHLLLARAVGRPLVATSGNRSGEPICLDADTALAQLGEIADLFLVHDRPIRHRVDDSVVRIVDGAPLLLRAGRGYAPVALPLGLDHAASAGGVGAHLKTTVCVSVGDTAIVSPHIGDLDTPATVRVHAESWSALCAIYGVQPATVGHDRHPDMASTRLAQQAAPPGGALAVQHHAAHALAVAGEAGVQPPFAALVWDGTGDGGDGTVWGGELLQVVEDGWSRIGCLRPFVLPGGAAAIREPRRAAVGLLYAAGGKDWVERSGVDLADAPTRNIWCDAIAAGLNAPQTSSVGRLFDAVAALLGLCATASYEGQAAQRLEASVTGITDVEPYPFHLGWVDGLSQLDWQPLLAQLLADVRDARPRAEIAAAFHLGLADAAVALLRHLNVPTVVLGGGCFVNRLLSERICTGLRTDGVDVHLPRRLPPGDGAISYGQTVAVAWGVQEVNACA